MNFINFSKEKTKITTAYNFDLKNNYFATNYFSII